MSEALQLVFLNISQDVSLYKLLSLPFTQPSKSLYDELIQKIKQTETGYMVNACFLEMLQFMTIKNERMVYLYNSVLDLSEPYIVNIVNQHIYMNGHSKLFRILKKNYEFLIPEYPNEEKKAEAVVINLYPIWLQIREHEDMLQLKSDVVNGKHEKFQISTNSDLLNSDQEGCLKITFSKLTLSNGKSDIVTFSLGAIEAYTWQEMEYPTIKLKRTPISTANLVPREDDSIDTAELAFTNCKSLCLLIEGRMYSLFPILQTEVLRIENVMNKLLDKPPFHHSQFILHSLFQKMTILKKSIGVKSNISNDRSKLIVSQKNILSCLHKVLQDNPTQSQNLLVLLEYSCGAELQVLKETINVLRQYWSITYTEQRQLNILSCLARILTALAQSPRDSVAQVKNWLIQIEDTISPYQQYFKLTKLRCPAYSC
eukprot:NODE_254_length_12812_cov_0.286872.p4 type:complete len:428 gc:universal NODE_254_length_12812_cov_0.286872:4362-5645(+)